MLFTDVGPATADARVNPWCRETPGLLKNADRLVSPVEAWQRRQVRISQCIDNSIYMKNLVKERQRTDREQKQTMKSMRRKIQKA